MALNPNPIGKAIADYLEANAPAPGTPIGIPQLENLWQNIMALIYNDIKANMDVLPAGLTGPGLESATGIPGTVLTGPGAGGSTETTSPEPIIGTGSVM